MQAWMTHLPAMLAAQFEAPRLKWQWPQAGGERAGRAHLGPTAGGRVVAAAPGAGRRPTRTPAGARHVCEVWLGRGVSSKAGGALASRWSARGTAGAPRALWTLLGHSRDRGQRVIAQGRPHEGGRPPVARLNNPAQPRTPPNVPLGTGRAPGALWEPIDYRWGRHGGAGATFPAAAPAEAGGAVVQHAGGSAVPRPRAGGRPRGPAATRHLSLPPPPATAARPLATCCPPRSASSSNP